MLPVCFVFSLALLTGCPSDGENHAVGGGSGSISSSSGGPTATKAWDDLRSQARLAQIGGLFVNVNGRNPLQFIEDEEKRANMESDRAMQSPLPATALNVMVDDMAQYLVTSLPNIPEVKSAPNQLILAFGDLMDPSKSSNPAVEQALDTLRNKIFQSELMKANFVFVSTTESDANKLSEKIAGKDLSAFRDPLQRTADQTKAVVYDPASIFIITGKLYSVPDNAHHSVQITMSMQFQHVLSRRVVDNKQFVKTYMWHPKKHEWELQG